MLPAHFRPSVKLLKSRRAFSLTSVAMAKHEWMVIIPDKPNSLAKRMEIRPEHLKNVLEQEKTGFWLLGGASLDEPVKEGSGPKINGSVMLGLAETKEEILEKLQQDVYWTHGVWDVEKIQIFPFRSAIRSGL